MTARFTMAVAGMLAVGCGQSSPLTDSGTRDGTPPRDGVAVLDSATPTAIICNAGEAMCVGDQLGSCTLGGHDAVLLQDCRAGGTATNPGRCATSACAGGARACCARAEELCVYAISSPTVDYTGHQLMHPADDVAQPQLRDVDIHRARRTRAVGQRCIRVRRYDRS